MLRFLGTLFFGASLLDDKLKKYDLNCRKTKLDSINSKIDNHDLRMQLSCPKNTDEFWIMADSVSDDMVYIFGEKWRDELRAALSWKIQYPNDFFNACCKNGYHGTFISKIQIVYYVWLSTKGIWGFPPYRSVLYRGIGDVIINDNSKEVQSLCLRAFETMEKHLRRIYPDLDLMLCTTETGQYKDALAWKHYLEYCDAPKGKRLW